VLASQEKLCFMQLLLLLLLLLLWLLLLLLLLRPTVHTAAQSRHNPHAI
jgi:hypothetical protein